MMLIKTVISLYLSSLASLLLSASVTINFRHHQHQEQLDYTNNAIVIIVILIGTVPDMTLNEDR